MDALPIFEASGKPWASTEPGKMHACGHDGHTAMLLAAAKHLARTREFKGSIALIFQPAEEVELPSGGFKMVQEGKMERFNLAKVFSMHNWPGMDVGKFGICAGGNHSSPGRLRRGRERSGRTCSRPSSCGRPGGHRRSDHPWLPILVTRHVDPPLESLVLSVTKLTASEAYNVIPDHVNSIGHRPGRFRPPSELCRNRDGESGNRNCGGVRSADRVPLPSFRAVTLNSPAETAAAVEVARGIAGDARVNDQMRPYHGRGGLLISAQGAPGRVRFPRQREHCGSPSSGL
ncbi:M20/M25/M40 family metallo-hydrolase [Mesorhizobium cantuariense]|uniref:M20/M25/M40 family metallo-hydrolase n=1 Tax=Mesorhizobium cantuariense TaxID=1300275 RepID=A0ABV7MFQ5_9HYPH